MVKHPPVKAGDGGSIPGSERALGGGKWQCTPVFLPGKPHGQRSPAGCSPWGPQSARHDWVHTRMTESITQAIELTTSPSCFMAPILSKVIFQVYNKGVGAWVCSLQNTYILQHWRLGQDARRNKWMILPEFSPEIYHASKPNGQGEASWRGAPNTAGEWTWPTSMIFWEIAISRKKKGYPFWCLRCE